MEDRIERSVEEINSAIDAADRNNDGSEYIRGVTDALRWVMSEGYDRPDVGF